ncbi:MAG: hypothetical protein JXR07_20285 [Reichenbachiella sp.]
MTKPDYQDRYKELYGVAPKEDLTIPELKELIASKEAEDIDTGSGTDSGSSKAGLPSENNNPESNSAANSDSYPEEGTAVGVNDGSGSDSGSSMAGLPSDEDDSDNKNPDVAMIGAGAVVVIPFKKAPAKGNELQFALRAWAKHLPGCKIVIIGDREDWFSDEVIHIEHEHVSKNPQIDVAHKMMAAIASDEVPEVFIWSNDDIYPMAPMSAADLDFHKSMGRLKLRGASGGMYRDNSERTLVALKKAGIKKPWDYACHAPTVFDKEGLATVIAKFKADQKGFLVSTLYFNINFPEDRPVVVSNGREGSIVASVFRGNVNKHLLEAAINERKFINNNDAGWPAVLPYLKKLFPDPSEFEK